MEKFLQTVFAQFLYKFTRIRLIPVWGSSKASVTSFDKLADLVGLGLKALQGLGFVDPGLRFGL